MLIKWDEINSVNVKEFDDHHKKLVEIINRFFAADKEDFKNLNVIISELTEYANMHLKAEEDCFDKFGFEKAEEHKSIHAAYREKVAGFKEAILSDNEELRKSVPDEVYKFLRDWWIFHINNVDHEYSDFFNRNGLY